MGAYRFHQLFAQVVGDETTKLPALEPLQVRIKPSKRFWVQITVFNCFPG
jgi:hypothetical protein